MGRYDISLFAALLIRHLIHEQFLRKYQEIKSICRRLLRLASDEFIADEQ